MAQAPTDPHAESFVAATQECSGHDAQWMPQESRAQDGGLEEQRALQLEGHAHHLPSPANGYGA